MPRPKKYPDELHERGVRLDAAVVTGGEPAFDGDAGANDAGHQAPQRLDEHSRVGDRAELPFEIVPVGEEISSVIGREAVPRIDGKSIEDDD